MGADMNANINYVLLYPHYSRSCTIPRGRARLQGGMEKKRNERKKEARGKRG